MPTPHSCHTNLCSYCGKKEINILDYWILGLLKSRLLNPTLNPRIVNSKFCWIQFFFYPIDCRIQVLLNPTFKAGKLAPWALGNHHCAVFTLNCVLCTVCCVLFTVWCVLCTMLCALCTVQCAPYTQYCAPGTVHCVLCILHCALYSVHC